MASLYGHRRKRGLAFDPFIDLLFNTLLGFSFLFMVSLLFINPEASDAKVELQAEYIISATWDETLKDDVDLWVLAPTGHRVSYLERESGWLHLDRDDRGVLNDTIMVDGQEVTHQLNQEIVTIRGKQVGEYVVNLYYYQNASPLPLKVKLRVDKVNPTLETVFIDTISLNRADEEKTAVRFSLAEDGSVHSINRLPTILTPYLLDPSQLDQMPEWATSQ